MVRFLRSIAGVAGAECAVLLAVAAVAFLLSAQDMSTSVVEFATGNF